MTIWEAFEHLKSGEAVRNSAWTNKDFHLMLYSGGLGGRDHIAMPLYATSLGSTDFNGTWELWEPPVATFSFGEAMKWVAEGKHVRRKIWASSNKLGLAGCNEVYLYVNKIVQIPYNPTRSEILSDDWHEVS